MGIIDTVIDKTKTLKSEYDQRKRTEKEDWLNVKEGKLEAKEQALNQQEKALQQLARTLAQQEEYMVKIKRRPLYVLLACLVSAGFVFNYLITNYEFTKIIQPKTEKQTAVEIKQDTEIATSQVAGPSYGGQKPEPTEPPTDRERKFYQSYKDLDMNHGNFDVGRYCLNEEKKGVMTFEQCLGMAVVKASGSR